MNDMWWFRAWCMIWWLSHYSEMTQKHNHWCGNDQSDIHCCQVRDLLYTIYAILSNQHSYQCYFQSLMPAKHDGIVTYSTRARVTNCHPISEEAFVAVDAPLVVPVRGQGFAGEATRNFNCKGIHILILALWYIGVFTSCSWLLGVPHLTAQRLTIKTIIVVLYRDDRLHMGTHIINVNNKVSSRREWNSSW